MRTSKWTVSWCRKHIVGAALLCLGLMASAVDAWGQAGGTGPLRPGAPGAAPVQEVTQPLAPTPPVVTPGNLLGDWFGLRTKLSEMGIVLGLGMTSELAKNVTGERIGFDIDTAFVYSADIDWGKLANLNGLHTHFLGVTKTGRNLSSDYLGDHIGQAQEIFGATFDMGFKFVYLYGDLDLADGRVNVAAGRMPMDVDFATSPFNCVPIALTPQCGVPRAIATMNAFPNGPVSTWGGRVRMYPLPELYVQTGAYETQPFPAGGRTGWQWGTSNATGLAVPLEIGWNPSFGGTSQLTGHYKIGGIFDTSTYPDLLNNVLGQPIGLFNTLPGAPIRGQFGLWVMADQMLYRWGPIANQGLILQTSYAHVAANSKIIANTAFVGLGAKGFFPSRPLDVGTVSFGWWGINNRLTTLQEIDRASGLPIANGALGPQTSEYVMEADYSFLVYPGVVIEPGIQYWWNPNADRLVKNALVFAGRLHIDF
ncbi:MAG: carbohydrate porin [Acetobacteraceae bacterium]|nr:carbohydrate porin [Acetobacteraceae bacterium]